MPNASEPNFALTQCDFQFHYNLWVIRAHQDIRPFRRALSLALAMFLEPVQWLTMHWPGQQLPVFLLISQHSILVSR